MQENPMTPTPQESIRELLEPMKQRLKAATPGIMSVSAECPECDAGWAAVTAYNGNEEIWVSEIDRELFASSRTDMEKLIAALEVATDGMEVGIRCLCKFVEPCVRCEILAQVEAILKGAG